MPTSSIFSQVAPCIFRVQYNTVGDMDAARQQLLVQQLETAQALGPLKLAFILSPEIKSVPVEVPTFWLKATQKLSIAAIGVASPLAAVRIATTGFFLAQQVRTSPIAVKWFPNEHALMDWVLSGSGAAAARKAV